ncbi:alpha-xenorhabdolysin family binary toxin subunit A [Pseudomonas lundensis]|uniref:alpha-xenorhabdolysin family binary toxin subunit A n=1 Tax=Pseudomonas lundensis TaxID=86185 RepID=UPI00147519FC|nr:alpha-xenorhabdolysin family binary toxin subunit A [Pseudomonas lundensis]NMZ96581.1 alpha-xenorhabdolysin family binary toxin subunit A [Pseudomonas lundensis]
MDSLALGNDLEGVRDLSVDVVASRLPGEYIKLVAGLTPSAVDPKEIGFLIRREDIHNTRKYVEFAKMLPLSLDVVRKRLNYDRIDVEGLSPEDILKLNERAVAHANTWPKVESGSKEVARELEKFAANFITTGEGVVSLIRAVELGRQLEGTFEDLTEEEQEKLHTILLDRTEKTAIEKMVNYLADAKKSTAAFIKSVEHVEALAKGFEKGLSDDLIPLVKTKMMAYKNSGKEHEREALLEDVLQLNDKIDALASAYKSAVGASFSGLALGPIGLVVTGGIFGNKAENIRKEKNKLIADRRKLLEKLKNADKLAELLDDLQLHLVNLQGQMLGAEVGAKQLSQIWTYIAAYLDEASESLSKVDTLLELHKFAMNFSMVINPWISIKGYSTQISAAFNELLQP